MDVFVVTKGFLLDHTLVGVYSSLAAAKRASGVSPAAEWSHGAPRLWTRPIAASGRLDEAWIIEVMVLDAAPDLTAVA